MTNRAAPFAPRGIDHVVLRARDVPALVAFYVDMIGCTVERVVGELTQMRAGLALIDVVPRDADESDGATSIIFA